MTALVRLIARVNRSLDLDQVLQSGLDGIRHIIGGDFGCFLLLQPNSPTLHLAHAYGLPAPLHERLRHLALPPETTIAAQDTGNTSRVMLEIGQHARAALVTESVAQFLLIPLAALSRAIGVLIVGTHARAPIPPASVDLLMTLGEQIGMAIENARLHAALKESETWHRAFIENSMDACLEGGFAGEIRFVNNAACAIFESDRDALLRTPLSEIVVDIEEYRRVSKEILQRDGYLLNRLARVRTGKGNIKTVSYTARLLRDSQSQIVGYQTIFRDVTGEQQAVEALRRRMEELAALNAIAGILSHPLETEQALHQVCAQVATITGMDTAAVFLLDSSAQHITLAAHSGVSENLLLQVQHIGTDDPFIHAIVIKGQALALNDVMVHNGGEFAGPRAEGYHAGIGVPIFRRGKPIGTIFVGSKTKSEYAPADMALLQNIGNQIGVALDNADLYEKMQQRIEELDGLAQLSAACTASLDPAALADTVVKWTVKTMSVCTCTLRTLEGESIILQAGYHHCRETPLSERLPLDDAMRTVLEGRQTFRIENVDTDVGVLPSHRQIMNRLGLKSLLAVPIAARDRVIGALVVGRAEPHHWLPREVDLLQTIANHAANAIENAKLFQHVEQERRKVQAIFDSGISGLFATDGQGRIMMLNRAAERMTGWTLEEVQGKLWTEVFGDTGSHMPEPLINEALIRKQPAYASAGRTMRTRDGRVIPVAKAVAPLLDANDQVTGAVGAFWDRSREEAALLTREHFLMMVAHELRSPLASLLSALQLYERKTLSTERRVEMWSVIQSEGERLRKFADQFLDMQSSQSFAPLCFQPLSVVTLARELVKRVRANFPGRSLRVKAPSPEPTAYADPDRVEQILRNLVDNALHYSPEGSRITISVKSLDDGMVRVAVQDTGAGIAPQEQQYIFDPFFRSANPPTRRAYGHGLGLWLARSMVTELGGKIWLESTPGHGTTFYFTLRGTR